MIKLRDVFRYEYLTLKKKYLKMLMKKQIEKNNRKLFELDSKIGRNNRRCMYGNYEPKYFNNNKKTIS